jgi:hypothetical protein
MPPNDNETVAEYYYQAETGQSITYGYYWIYFEQNRL